MTQIPENNRPVIELATGRAFEFSDGETDLNNSRFKWCVDNPGDDVAATYDEFTLKPDYQLPPNVAVRINLLWGWDENDNMTEPVDFVAKPTKPAKLRDVVHGILAEYHAQENFTGRFLYIEEARYINASTIEITWGT